MSQEKIKNIVEAAIMVANQPLSINHLLNLFVEGEELQAERADIEAALEQLQTEFDDRGIEIVEVASGFRVQARNDYALWINRLFEERPPRYSRALLETLAIIAYRQPITRAEIEDIRGVSVSSSIVKTLQEREWVKVVGHRDVPGKPALLATTKSFLDYFNLKKLSDLPALADIKDFDSINPDLFEALEETDKEQDQEQTQTSDNDADFAEIETEAKDQEEGVAEEVDVEADTVEMIAESEPDTEQSDSSGAQVIPFNN